MAGDLDDRQLREIDAQLDKWRSKVKDRETRKVYDEVFDRIALLAIAKLISDRKVETVDYPVSTGKEGNVFRATAPDGRALALKIYRVTNATYRNLSKYIIGDHRFRRAGRSHREMIEAWATKEHANLARMHAAGARVPEPLELHRNLLVMEYLGDEGGPAPVLKTLKVDDPQALYDDLVGSMAAIRSSGLVHGDLSEYNILLWDGRAWIIDVGQSVPLNHDRAAEWQRRDLENMAKYFTRLGLDVTADSLDAATGA